MKRTNFTQYDDHPEGMIIYMRNYGPHFSKKLYEFAVSKMYKVEELNRYFAQRTKNMVLNLNTISYMMLFM